MAALWIGDPKVKLGGPARCVIGNLLLRHVNLHQIRDKYRLRAFMKIVPAVQVSASNAYVLDDRPHFLKSCISNKYAQ